MSSNQTDVVHSEEFGEFVPEPSSTLAITDREAVSMAEQVVAGLWEIPPDVFKELPEKLYEIAMSGTRLSVKAAGVLLDMNQQNDSQRAVESVGGDVVIYIPDNGRGVTP